ncbi:phage holin family protein [Aneurinibacillus uraniidurans]|uniref:phage holin family protein n=1 Tax=Aneurinibacillus uraniidurans TaxID=2966586 RepID=UPI00234BE6C6|nr:phage holin family protein [Aneurinibacillus sp. B1]WCN39545.1 phage holin family protein [Aneurinibacillus sp. B1]
MDVGSVISQIQLAPGMLVIPAVLMVIGYVAKQSSIIPDKHIPLLILAAGIGFGLWVVGLNVSGVVQGIGAAGITVLGHQTIKQQMK